MNLLGSLFRTAPAPGPATPAPRLAAPDANASRTIRVRVDAAQLVLMGGVTQELQAAGPLSVERTPSGMLVTGAHIAGPPSICRLDIPDGVIVDLELGAGGLTVHRFRGTLRARVQKGGVSVEESEGTFRLVVPEGKVAFDRVSGEIDVLSAGGTVTARQTKGGLQAVSNSGDMEFESIEGPIAARTINGNIDATDLHGAARLSTRTGAIRVSGACGQLAVHTQSGDVDLDCSVVAHTTLDTVKGNLSLKLGPLTSARLEARVGQGVVRAEGIAPLPGSNRRSLRGTLGRGEARLQATSRVGVIHVVGPPLVPRAPKAKPAAASLP